MAQDLSFEDPKRVFFSTIRTMNSRLWFINNCHLQERILAYLAKYQEVYGIIIYAFIVMGNHYHLLARFPNRNKAKFFKDFNSMIARLTNTHVPQFEGGKLWARRVRSQVVGDKTDIKDRFFYTVLNPVGAGLTRRISDHSGYNSFYHAAKGIKKTYKVVDYADYNNRKRYNKNIAISDCTTQHTLTFTRLPGFEKMPDDEYYEMLKGELDRRQQTLVETRIKEGKGFATKKQLEAQEPGAKPKSTKTSKRDSKRPLILTSSIELKQRFLKWYFALLETYKVASRRFRDGKLNTVFPEGTYRPPSFAA